MYRFRIKRPIVIANTKYSNINMKSRKEELEVELGISDMNDSNLSNQQVFHIEKDFRRAINPNLVLEIVNLTIQADENIICGRH